MQLFISIWEVNVYIMLMVSSEQLMHVFAGVSEFNSLFIGGNRLWEAFLIRSAQIGILVNHTHLHAPEHKQSELLSQGVTIKSYNNHKIFIILWNLVYDNGKQWHCGDLQEQLCLCHTEGIVNTLKSIKLNISCCGQTNEFQRCKLGHLFEHEIYEIWAY